MSTFKKLARLAAASFLSSLTAVAMAAEIPYVHVDGAMPVPIRENAGLKSRVDLETFLDGVMADQLASHNLSGAVISVVKNGKLFFTKGYGYANIESGQAMDGKNSLVRPGSVSKLITWTALMQLVEQGKLDLDTNVNEYLTSLKLPNTFEQPITIRNLLTHTPGLEDGGVGYLMAAGLEDLLPLAEFLTLHMPERMRPPTTDFSDGRNASYSNWGTALAGVIIADVTGESFDDYVEKHIFQPLGMSSSTFAEPLPEELAERMAQGYVHKAGTFKTKDFELIHNFGPAGSMTSSAPDMANFMIAHLNNGRFGNKRILKEDTAKLMHSRQFSPSPHVNGAGLGFFETRINGRCLLTHAGDTGAFHSDLHLLKEEGMGLFVSYSSAASIPISSRSFLLQAFMDRYYPATLPRVTPPEDFAERAGDYAGSYRMTRGSHTKIEKLFSAFGSIKVAPTEDNTLLITGFLGGDAQWVEIAPDTFRRVHTDHTVAFLRDETGEVSHLTIPIPFIAAYKLAWYETSEAHGLIVAIALLCAVIALVSAFRKRKLLPRDEVRARTIAGITGVLVLCSFVTLGLSIMGLMEDPIGGFPATIHVALALILLTLLFSLLTAYQAGKAWRGGLCTFGGRIRYTIVALAFLALMWSFNFWNLVGYKFG